MHSFPPPPILFSLNTNNIAKKISSQNSLPPSVLSSESPSPHAIITPAVEVHKLSKFRAVVIVSHALKYYYHGSSVQTYRKDLKSPRLLFSNIIGNNRVLRMRCKVLLFKKERGEKSGDWKYWKNTTVLMAGFLHQFTTTSAKGVLCLAGRLKRLNFK